jgi:hypothetical protein
MKANYLLVLTVLVSVLAGAFLASQMQPAPAPAEPASGLIDGKYIVVDNESGHWVYEVSDKGLTPRVKDMSPTGLASIWELQGKFVPYAVDVGGVALLNVPSTAYSTETGAFQVIHSFYKMDGDKLVEVELQARPRPK